MRKSLFVGAALAIVLVAIDFHLASPSPIRVTANIASAQELPDFAATTTLAAVQPSVWGEPQTPNTDGANGTASVAPPSQTAAPVAAQTAVQKQNSTPVAETPVRLIIPSIGLDTRIISVGLNGKGEMDVPSGSTNDVGWYKGGPKPGQMGSSVLDAHVFAAFKHLHKLKVGSDVIVETSSGQRLRFVVDQSSVYKLSNLTSSMLFGRSGDRWLNLITCAGQPVGNTYSHRLIAYTKFVEVL